MNRSISHFENCVSAMHRAIKAYRQLRNHKTRDSLSVYLTNPKPIFISDQVADQIRKVRDAIHHLEEKVVKGDFEEGLPIAIKPFGEETSHPSQPDKIIKTIDRLKIGPHELKFSDVAKWLNEMLNIAVKIAQYDRLTGRECSDNAA
ncbi:MAG: hypothetical protein P4M12_09020 [Gammaproteobacteria bacterium]|nr:hypothetical protein [Gammaproteobacteria bacterium]